MKRKTKELSELELLEKRLKKYKKALRAYKLYRRFPFLKSILDTDYGFCNYFNATNTPYIKRHLPELYQYKPYDYMTLYVGGFWFNVGEIEPRIELLEKAIDCTTKKIETLKPKP